METNSIDRVAEEVEDAREVASELEQIPTPIELPKDTLDYFNGDELRARVFYEKYALKNESGLVIERTPVDMWGRVAHELASVELTEEKRKEWEKKFNWLMENFRFIPGGRIMFGAGQPRRATLLNCLRGDTTVLVQKSVEVNNSVLGYNNSVVSQITTVVNSVVSVPIKEIVGHEVRVLTPSGWSTVRFQSYGRQKLYKIVLRNGDTMYATGNHEWVIRSNQKLIKKTTKELMTYRGDNGLVVYLPPRPIKDEKYYEGIVHGIVYGDGSKATAKYCKTYSVWLFGAQRELAKYLPHAHEYTGEQAVFKNAVSGSGIRSPYDLKKLPPITETSSYWYGFICGYLATDGWANPFGNQAGIDSQNRENLMVIRSQLPRIGLMGHKIALIRKENPYNGLSAPLYRLCFWKASLSEDLFLRSDHLAKYQKSSVMSKRWTIGIDTIAETDLEEEVYCCEEPLTHTFTLGNGVLTGNCYYIPIKGDSLEDIFDFCKEAGRTYSYGGGVGCIEKDALVITQKGIKKIQDVKETEKVLSFDNTLEQFDWKRVLKSHKFEVAKDDSFLLGMENGSYMITSYWHPTLVYDNGAFLYKRADEVREDDLVLSPNMEKDAWFEYECSDPQLGWLLGAYLGDGSAYSSGKKTYCKDYGGLGKERESFRLKFANDDQDVCTTFASSLNVLYGGRTNARPLVRQNVIGKKELYQVSTNGYYVQQLLANSDWQVGRKALNLRVPSLIWSSSRETVFAFLAGLIDTDGHVVTSKQRISYSTISKQMIEDLQSLLSLFGARSYYRIRKRRMSTSGVRGRHDTYELIFSDIDLVKEISRYVTSADKKRKMMSFTKQYNKKKPAWLTTDFVEYFLGLAQNRKIWSPTIRSQIRSGKRSLERDLFIDGMKKLVSLTQGKDKVLAQYYLRLIPKLHRVSLVQKGGGRTTEFYDLTVEDNNNYVAGFGGFYVVHNTDISILRPKGAPVNNSAVVSTGSVSFMELFSVTTGTIGQAGRRGALMITIHVDHPDVVDFIDVKRDLSKVTHANISVCLTDKFMKAVENDEPFELAFKNEKADFRRVIRARDLWDKLVSSAHASAEPGIIFWDNVKNESPTEYNGMEVHGFNPCSEQCLEDFGCCCLGNINLSAFVVDEFSDKARIDWRNLEKAARYATRFLDNVLDYNSDKHPLPEQTKASLWSRRIGVGFTGLADMLIKMNLKYDTQQSVRFIDKTLEKIKNIVYDESTNLAKEKGKAPALIPEKHLARPFVSRLDASIKEKIRQNGLRNSCLLTVPPVGSGAILAGTTSGIEPIFALSYVRKSKSLSGGEFKVYHPLVQEYLHKFQLKSEKELPDTFVTAHSIKADFRVQMQGTIQKHIDSSISSTVNIPRETTVEEVKKIYIQAWKSGCKGITVYREGAREGILLTEAEAAKQKGIGAEEKPEVYDRPKTLTGTTVKMKLPQGNLYVTANRNGDNVIRETFVTLGKSGGDEKADAEALGRLISLFLQHGGNIQDVIHSLKGIQGRDVSWDNGQQLLSVPDAVAKALENITGQTVQLEPEMKHCPDCGESSIIFENGCYRCVQCGYSKCS